MFLFVSNHPSISHPSIPQTPRWALAPKRCPASSEAAPAAKKARGGRAENRPGRGRGNFGRAGRAIARIRVPTPAADPEGGGREDYSQRGRQRAGSQSPEALHRASQDEFQLGGDERGGGAQPEQDTDGEEEAGGPAAGARDQRRARRKGPPEEAGCYVLGAFTWIADAETGEKISGEDGKNQVVCVLCRDAL